MKLLIFFMALSLSHIVLAQLGGYTEVPRSEYENDEEIQELLHSGADYVVQQGIKSGRLPNSKFTVTQTIRVETQVVAGLNYRFNVELSNGEMTVRAQYVVYLAAGTEEPEVTDYSFDITSASNEFGEDEMFPYNRDENETPGGWSPVDITELNTDSNLRNILNFGVRYVIEQGTQSGQFPGSNYYIEDIISIESQVVSGMNYRFSVVLGNTEEEENTVSFEVYDQPWTSTREVTDYEFAESEGEEEGTLLGGWESRDPDDLETDQDLKTMFDFGVQDVVGQVVDNNQLSTSDYQLSQVYSIKTQVVSGMNYRFNVRLENAQGGYVTVIFTVYDQPWTNTREVTSYYFIDIQDGEVSSDDNAGSGSQGVAVNDGGASD